MAKSKTLRITQIKSGIGYKPKAKATLIALGLRKMHQTVEDNLVFNKFNKMSSQINQISDILNEFQNSHVVIKKPEDGIGEG